MTEAEPVISGPVVPLMPMRTRTRDRFEEFYRAELPGVVALARGLCPPGMAEDVAQEAMLAAYRRWSALDDHPNPTAWVRRTCANLAVSSFRRRLVEVRAVARFGQRSPLPPLDEDAEEFWALVRRLPKRQAQAAALRYVFDLDILDIAETLGVSEGSVKVHLSRARRRLAAELGLDSAEGES
jgi:RNA polymerase sigma-70 factor (ECF subfamily)